MLSGSFLLSANWHYTWLADAGRHYVTLILEIATGIVLGVALLLLGYVFLILLLENETARIVTAIIVVILLVVAYKVVFPDKEKPAGSTVGLDSGNTRLETRAHFAMRYKKAHPEHANTPDEELVKQVLHDHPEYCSLVEGGCQ